MSIQSKLLAAVVLIVISQWASMGALLYISQHGLHVPGFSVASMPAAAKERRR